MTSCPTRARYRLSCAWKGCPEKSFTRMRMSLIRSRGSPGRDSLNLLLDPLVRFRNTLPQRLRGHPPNFFAHEPVVRIPAAYTLRSRYVRDFYAGAGNVSNEMGQVVDRDHLFRADVYRPAEVRPDQADRRLDAFVDEQEGPRLLAIAPDLDRAVVFSLGDLTADRRRRLFLAIVPRPFRAEDVMVAGHPALYAVVPVIGFIEPLAEELLPSILAVGGSRIGALFGAFRIGGIELVIQRVDTGRGAVKNPPHRALGPNAVQNV